MVAIRYSRCPAKFLLWILITILNKFVASVSASLGGALANVSFSPPYLDQLQEGSNHTVWIKVSFQRQLLDGKYVLDAGDVADDRNSGTKIRPFVSPPLPPSASVVLSFKTDDMTVARVVDPPVAVHRKIQKFDPALASIGSANSTNDGNEDENWYFNTSFTIQGLFLGKTKIEIQVALENDESSARSKRDGSYAAKETNDVDVQKVEILYNVWVVRPDKKLAHIFVGTLMILLILANVLMGAQLNLNIIYEVIKKPFAPLIGFVCQFLIMPLISFCLARLIFIPVGQYNMALGLFTTGCCPGGGASNAYTVLLDGNVDLSITMTFLSTLLSLATMPLWMFALGRQFLFEQSSRRINVPYSNICYSLLMLVLPLCAGTLVRRFSPKNADRAKKVLRPFLLLIILFICTFGVYVNLYMFRLMSWRVLLGGMGLPWLGFAFGLIVAVLGGQPKPNVVAISVETGIQNTGIAIMLLQLSFMQPDADLAAVLPVVVAMFTPAPMVIALVIHYLSKYRENKRKKMQEACNAKAIENGTASMICESTEEKLDRGATRHRAILDDNENEQHLGVSGGDENAVVANGHGFVDREKDLAEENTKMLGAEV